MNDPKLLNEIRSAKYTLIFSASLVGFSVTIGNPRALLATILCCLVGLASLVGALTSKYYRR